ncbi:hypothetical protein [Microbacterium sp. SSM24]|uniref:hypothetical protein n=1 Tax=Microbacterium sp. SSM24 TaxID=2991714 RepID=UPI002225E578|nr:hypothetical protein [Microbacterium sp. SSM24]MCW3493328.1 hypothetical protein [Microbacterium sp. SSM24]
MAATVLAVVGVAQGSTAINQNSTALDGLNDSLQRADIAAVYEVGMSWCGDPDRDIVTSTIATAILTNVGRLPITVMHVGDGSREVNDFASAPVGDAQSGAKKGPFLLEVGRAMYVAYGSNRVDSVSSEVVLRLSDGTTARTRSAGGEARWLTSVMPSIAPDDVLCPSGVLMSVPLADLGSSSPDFVVATPSPSPSP